MDFDTRNNAYSTVMVSLSELEIRASLTVEIPTPPLHITVFVVQKQLEIALGQTPIACDGKKANRVTSNSHILLDWAYYFLH